MVDEAQEKAPLRTRALQPDDEVRPDQGAYLELLRTHDALVHEASRFFQTYGITHQQYNVLRILYVRAQESGISCQEIGQRLIERVPDITRLLDRLERAELIRRTRCRDDRRVVRVQLTERGLDLVEELHPRTLELHQTLVGHVSDDDLRTAIRVLRAMRTPPEPS